MVGWWSKAGQCRAGVRERAFDVGCDCFTANVECLYADTPSLAGIWRTLPADALEVGSARQSQGKDATQADAPDGSRRQRPHRRAMGSAQWGVEGLRPTAARRRGGPVAAATLCWRSTGGRDHGGQVVPACASCNTSNAMTRSPLAARSGSMSADLTQLTKIRAALGAGTLRCREVAQHVHSCACCRADTPIAAPHTKSGARTPALSTPDGADQARPGCPLSKGKRAARGATETPRGAVFDAAALDLVR